MELTKKFVDENLKKGYIVHSKSPMASLLFFVGKKDGSSRPCQDYQKLNEGTIKDAFPLLNIQDFLRDLCGAKYFTKLDIRWGYSNIQIKPQTKSPMESSIFYTIWTLLTNGHVLWTLQFPCNIPTNDKPYPLGVHKPRMVQSLYGQHLNHCLYYRRAHATNQGGSQHS